MSRPRQPRGRARRARPARNGRIRALFWFLRWTAVLAIWAVFLIGGVILWYAQDLPDTSRLGEITRRPAVTLVTSDGEILATYGDLYGKYVGLDELPPYLPEAVLAVEDRRFYQHFGVDPLGVLRAIWVNIRTGDLVQGGSTITQQLAKNLFLNSERSLKRKVQEALLALWLEREFTKDQILTLYLNRVYLGAGAYGVNAAAQKYFGKPAQAVTLYEAAMLAGLLKAPSRDNPASDPDAAERRTQIVLRSMVAAGKLAPAEEAAAVAAKASIGRTMAAGRAGRAFADWVYDQVASYVGTTDRDLTVVTTIDMRVQRIAEAELARVLAEDGPKRKAGQGAVVVMGPNGAVRALVGGRDYGEREYNRATQALRQPGSAFKLFVFLAAIEAGVLPDDRIVDGPLQLKGWRPGNYQDRYFGEVTVREAFARSLNSVSVQLYLKAGPQAVARAAQRLGITSSLNLEPSLALGTSEVTLVELTSAYAAFANEGRGVWAHGIEEIRDATGTVLFRRTGDGPGRVVDPQAVERMNDLMTAVVGWGTGRGAALAHPAAGKTGTSQGFRDAWFVGFTADLVAGVWVGNDDDTPMDKVTGGSLPVRIWHDVMARALEDAPARPLPGGGVPEVADAGEDGQGFIAGVLTRLKKATSGTSPASVAEPATLSGARQGGGKD